MRLRLVAAPRTLVMLNEREASGPRRGRPPVPALRILGQPRGAAPTALLVSCRRHAEVVAVADDDRREDQHEPGRGASFALGAAAAAAATPCRAMPQSVLKMMMLAMCSVQLENLYSPICVSPIV